MRTLGAWKILGASALLMTAAIACGGGSSTDDELPSGEGAGGSAGSTAGKGGSSTAGKGGTGGTAAGAGGTAAGAGGTAAGAGGTAGKGGGTGGTGGSTAGTGGSTAGTGGSTAGTGGTAGKGGATGGTGGSTAGTGGTAGKGGATGGTGGGTAGKGGAGGSTAGSGGSTAGSGGSTAGAGGSAAGAGGGTAGSGGNCGPFGCSGGAGGGTGGTGGGTGSCDKNGDAVDDDGDGYALDDCNDCDPNTNPGAIDIINTDVNGKTLPDDQQVDEDCSGAPLLVGQDTSCDTGLAVDDADPFNGAKAMELCQKAANTPSKTHGVISAAYTQMNGTQALPNTPDAAVGHGIQTGWGANVKTQFGASMLVLSSGAARLPGQPGYESPGGMDKGYTSTNPPGFPIGSTGCSGNPTTGTLHDSVALSLKLRAPTNAKSFSFKFKFYTYEFPGFVCTGFNDVFTAAMFPPPNDPKVSPTLGNISFDSQGNALSVNNAFLDVCSPQTAGGKTFTCPSGIAELAGTGFDDPSSHAASIWLQTTAPVTSGQEFTLILGVADSADGVLDSTVLVDGFQWSANPGTVQTGNACKLGGAGACGPCLVSNTNPGGCCIAEQTKCDANNECGKLIDCVGSCAGSASCESFCFSSFAGGKSDYDARKQCLFATVDTSDPKNKGACGIACGVQAPLASNRRLRRPALAGLRLFVRLSYVCLAH